MSVDLFGMCPYATAQKVLSGKWSILIIHLLSDGPVRFNALLRQLPQMTHATLSKQLKTLEEWGLVVRDAYPEVPPRVEYRLSDIGQRFQIVLDSLEVWGNEYITYMNENKNASQPALK